MIGARLEQIQGYFEEVLSRRRGRLSFEPYGS